MDDESTEALAESYTLFARTMAHDGQTTYERICSGIAHDPWLLALTRSAPPDQRRPNLLLAAVHFLLLSGAEHPLADAYPTVVEWRAGPAAPAAPADMAAPIDVFSVFADFCRRFEAPLEVLLATRATQTNEVGRCAAILPALAMVGANRDRPLALVDLGASAGLNLLFDRFAYDYLVSAEVPATHVRAGDQDAAVRLVADVRSGTLPELVTPEIPFRRGLDRSPIDPNDDDGARWLLGCQWPDDLTRFRRLRAAIDVARSIPGLAEVARGDIIDDLGAMVEEVPDDLHLCLLHTWVAAYLTAPEQRSLTDAIAEASMRRPITWLFAEQPYEVPGLPVPPAPEGLGSKRATALVVATVLSGEVRPRRVADLHPHGTWLRWWAPTA